MVICNNYEYLILQVSSIHKNHKKLYNYTLKVILQELIMSATREDAESHNWHTGAGMHTPILHMNCKGDKSFLSKFQCLYFSPFHDMKA